MALTKRLFQPLFKYAAVTATAALFILSQPINSATYSPNGELKQASIEIANQLKFNHYRYINPDNDFSSEVLDRYLKELDPQRLYFNAADIADFEQYRFTLDNALNKGDLAPAYVIFNRYQERVEQRLAKTLALLEQGIDQFDFSKDEHLTIDRENEPWVSSPEELDDLWRKRIKNSVLGQLLADTAKEEIQEKLVKRYENQLNRLQQTNEDDVFQIYMNVVSQLYDPHTEYFAPRRSENFNINMSLSLEGIGAVLQADQEYTKIVRLVPGGPADTTKKLGPSDRIIGVAQEDGEMVNVIGWRLDDVVDLIRGRKGTKVTLDVIPKDATNDQESVQVAITRNKVMLEDQAAQKRIIEVPGQGKTFKVGVIDVPQFYADFAAYQAGDPNYKSTTRDVSILLQELKQEGVDGVIIDLRNNGGGSLNEANSLVGLFIKSGATVQLRTGQGRLKVFTDSDPEIAYDGPLAVMVNRLSASASEIFAGAIQDYQRGIVIGSQTFGKGTVQTLLPLQHGQLKVTQAKFYRISGNSTQHMGVLPDIELPEMVDVSEIGEDALPRALPWDTIRPVLFSQSGDISPFIAKLDALHQERIKTNADYQYRLEQIALLKENREKITLSLNLDARRKEQDEHKARRLALENARRKANGLELLDALEEEDEEEEADNQAATNAEDDEPDPYMLESGHILADYIVLAKAGLSSSDPLSARDALTAAESSKEEETKQN